MIFYFLVALMQLKNHFRNTSHHMIVKYPIEEQELCSTPASKYEPIDCQCVGQAVRVYRMVYRGKDRSTPHVPR